MHYLALIWLVGEHSSMSLLKKGLARRLFEIEIIVACLDQKYETFLSDF